jgi:hypothetical protein
LVFENTFMPAKKLGVSKRNADTEGFTPLQLDAISGEQRSETASAPPKFPGIHDDFLHRSSEDGGKVTYDRSGNVIAWESKDKSDRRTYIYHDTAKDRAALYGVKDGSVFQDKNGTYFQFQELNGHKTPVAKVFTRGFAPRDFADIRGTSQTEAIFQRAVNADGSPTIIPISLDHDLKISATLDTVTDNHGHIWQRKQPGQPLTEYVKSKNGHEVQTGKKYTDAQLLPVDLYVSAERQKLYADPKHPLASIKAISVEQTELGDCYFEAPVAEEAKIDPKRLVAMVRDNHDGTLTVKFPLSDPTFPSDVPFDKRPTVDVTVEAPTAPEMYTFNRPFDKKQNNGYWSSVFENAHRYLTGKINADDGGVGSDSLQLLTGIRRVTSFEHPSTASKTGDHPFQMQTFTADPRDTKDPKLDPDWLVKIKDALEKGEPVVARTPNNGSEWVIVTGGTDYKDVLGKSSEPGHDQDKFYILDSHVYSVIKVDHQSDGREDLITVRNPLSNVVPPSAKDSVRPFDQKDNGYFQVRPHDFENLFDGFFIN